LENLNELKPTEKFKPNLHFLDQGIGISRAKKNVHSSIPEIDITEDSGDDRSMSSNERELHKLEKKLKRKQDEQTSESLLNDLAVTKNKINLTPKKHEKLKIQTKLRIAALNNDTFKDNVD
jgi:hypothetical protein